MVAGDFGEAAGKQFSEAGCDGRGLGRRRVEEVPLSRRANVRSTRGRSETRTRTVRENSGSDGSQVRSGERRETSFSGFLRQEARLGLAVCLTLIL